MCVSVLFVLKAKTASPNKHHCPKIKLILRFINLTIFYTFQ